jgi:hypothetical protein
MKTQLLRILQVVAIGLPLGLASAGCDSDDAGGNESDVNKSGEVGRPAPGVGRTPQEYYQGKRGTLGTPTHTGAPAAGHGAAANGKSATGQAPAAKGAPADKPAPAAK